MNVVVRCVRGVLAISVEMLFWLRLVITCHFHYTCEIVMGLLSYCLC